MTGAVDGSILGNGAVVLRVADFPRLDGALRSVEQVVPLVE